MSDDVKLCSAFITLADDGTFCFRPADYNVMRRYHGTTLSVRPMCRRCVLNALHASGGGNIGIVSSVTVWRDQP